MRRRALLLAFLVTVAIAATPRAAAPASAVFAGDPVNSQTGLPYEILPGQPLVMPGADGRLGTADDVVDARTLGDIDVVVRLGNVSAGATIPDPAPIRGDAVIGTAGLRGAGVALPFRVYLSDGAVGPGVPYGHALAAADMDGLPVIVLLFADLDKDGFIGPNGADPFRQVRALAELQPVGREVAFFNGGTASGTVAVTAGSAPSGGGVTLVATALAFTGAYDPGVLGGFVPTGPGITTAQPFVPERDPRRLFTTGLGPLTVGGTLNPTPRAAALPIPGTGLDLALRTDGTSPTIDVGRAVAGPAVCARLVENVPVKRGVPPAPTSLTIGSHGSAATARLRIVAVDRLGNPTDPTASLTARISVDGPLAVAPDRDHLAQVESVAIGNARGRVVKLRATGTGSGMVRVSVADARCEEFAVTARAERDRHGADAVVALAGTRDFSTIGAAVAGASDRNGDGRVTIEVGEGVYRESVRVTRGLELRGRGAGRTIIDARGVGPALALADPAALAAGLTMTGGTIGLSLEAAVAATGLEAWSNVDAGVRLAAPGASASDCVARENGGDGFTIGAAASVNDSDSLGNAAAGISVAGVSGATVLTNGVAANGGDGIAVLGATDPTITGNAVAGNAGGGISLEATSGGAVATNRAAANDGEGLTLNRVTGAMVDRNDFSTNHGFGMRIDRSSADFDAAPGVQTPPGSNDTSGNRKGALQIR